MKLLERGKYIVIPFAAAALGAAALFGLKSGSSEKTHSTTPTTLGSDAFAGSELAETSTTLDDADQPSISITNSWQCNDISPYIVAPGNTFSGVFDTQATDDEPGAPAVLVTNRSSTSAHIVDARISRLTDNADGTQTEHISKREAHYNVDLNPQILLSSDKVKTDLLTQPAGSDGTLIISGEMCVAIPDIIINSHTQGSFNTLS